MVLRNLFLNFVVTGRSVTKLAYVVIKKNKQTVVKSLVRLGCKTKMCDLRIIV